MAKRILYCGAAVLALVAFGAFTEVEAADPPKTGEPSPVEGSATRPGSGGGGARPQDFGTIIYDDGIVTALPAASSNSYGNQFDTALGVPVQSVGTITQISAFIATGAGSDNVFVSIFGEVSGATASVLTSASLPLNNGSGSFNTFTFGPGVSYPGASFLAGIWYVGGDTVGLGSGTAQGQGHHGMLINDIAGTGFQTIPGINALLGASGNIVIPVELMDFEIE